MKDKKLHKNLVAGVLEALETSFGMGMYADKVVEKLLKTNKKWGSRDRAFVAEHTYEIVRWWRFLWALYGKEPILKRKEIYQLFGIYWKHLGGELPDWKQFDGIRDFDTDKALQSLPSDTGIRESFPEWMDERGKKERKEEWPAIAKALNAPAEVMVRTNTLKTDRDALIDILKKENIPSRPFPFNEVGLILEKRPNTLRSQAFMDGLYEVQDGGSQLIAEFTGAEVGMTVVDACAGAGGKSLAMGAAMENRGRLIAMDIEAWKLREFKRRAKRNGLSIYEVKTIENSSFPSEYENSADRLLLDVPCSGTGVIRRKPDTKWKLQPGRVDELRGIQREILRNYSRMLKNGGKMVYATCSIFASESEDQVREFLAENPQFELEEEKQLYPHIHGTDGFYMARMRKIQ